MLSVEANERLMRVGPGTPMGELLRRYWQPVATSAAIKENPVRAVRILGESLTLFRDRQGRLGLVAERCAHRGVNLRHGIPEAEGLRCPYHGWMYDTTGQCVDQPAESPESAFKNKVRIASYPVEELGGLIWGYLGPSPAPLLPRWSLFVWDNVFRQIGNTMIPANWLQCQENSVDTVHTEWLHGRFGEYVLERTGVVDEDLSRRFRRFRNHHVKIGFDRFEHGIIKRRLTEGQPVDAESWTVGHPLVFPQYVLIGQNGKHEFQMRIPVDDTTTWHISYHVFTPGPYVQAPPQDPVPSFDIPLAELPDFVLGQDALAWWAQGEMADRSVEHLAETDRGLIMFRKMLDEQIAVVQDGGDPMNTFRDLSTNDCLELPMEDYGDITEYRPGSVFFTNTGRHSHGLSELDALMREGKERALAARRVTGSDR